MCTDANTKCDFRIVFWHVTSETCLNVLVYTLVCTYVHTQYWHQLTLQSLCFVVQIEAGEGATAAIQQLEDQRKQLESRLADTQAHATQQTTTFTQQLAELQQQLSEEKAAAEKILQQLQEHTEHQQQLQQLIDSGKHAQADLEQQLKVKVMSCALVVASKLCSMLALPRYLHTYVS